LPLPPAEFKQYIKEFRGTNFGFLFEFDRSLGFIDDEIRYFEIRAKSIGDLRDPYDDKHPIFQKWEKFLKDFKDSAPYEL